MHRGGRVGSVKQQAHSLEAFKGAEPTPLGTLIVERGLLLATVGKGDRSNELGARLTGAIATAEHYGYHFGVPRLEAARLEAARESIR